MNGRLIEEDTRKASDIVDGIGNAPKGYEGVTEWRPKIPRHGFYSVVVTMLSSDASGKQTEEERKMDRRVIWLAVVAPLPMAADGDFGWSLPDMDNPLSFQDLTGLLPNAGINWVKFPAWYDVAKPRRGDEIIRFVEMLGASNIEVVGVHRRPPADSDLAERLGANPTIADLLVVRSVDLAAGARSRHVAAFDAAAVLATRQRPGHKPRRFSQAGRENRRNSQPTVSLRPTGEARGAVAVGWREPVAGERQRGTSNNSRPIQP